MAGRVIGIVGDFVPERRVHVRNQRSFPGRRYRLPGMDVVPLVLRPEVEDYTRLSSELAAGRGVDAAWLEAIGVPGDRFVQDSIDRAVACVRAERPSTVAEARRVLARAHGFES